MTDTRNFGKTPGYWKNHSEAYEDLNPAVTENSSFESLLFGNTTTYNFGNDGAGAGSATDLSFYEALTSNGGGVDALARHSAAAYLNASAPGDNYLLWQWEDILIPTKDVLLSGDANDIEDLKNIYDFFNNLQGYEQTGPDHGPGFFNDIFVEEGLSGWAEFLDLTSAQQFALINSYIDPI